MSAIDPRTIELVEHQAARHNGAIMIGTQQEQMLPALDDVDEMVEISLVPASLNIRRCMIVGVCVLGFIMVTWIPSLFLMSVREAKSSANGASGTNGDVVQQQDSSFFCGCPECTMEVWNISVGNPPATCGERIRWLQQNQSLLYPSELDACARLGSYEFPCDCGPCDPVRCGALPAVDPVTELPPNTPLPVTNVSRSQDDGNATHTHQRYCFPLPKDRVRFTLWNDLLVEVKESPPGGTCGPGNNRFGSSTVQVEGNRLTLQYTKGQGSEVRVFKRRNDPVPFSYGTYEFSLESIQVLNGTTGDVISDELPKELVLGMFTWDDTEDFSQHENYNHEVDIEISRWNCSDNADVQFLVQPEGYRMHRFFSGTQGTPDQIPTLSPSGHRYRFTWNPTRVDWSTDAGGGHDFSLTTAEAIQKGIPDYIQCLPDRDMEVRINLWNYVGPVQPHGLAESDVVQVVIDSFAFTPSTSSAVADGALCSKDCQCQSVSVCEESVCTSKARF